MTSQKTLDAIETLIHKGATPGERDAARAAYERLTGHKYSNSWTCQSKQSVRQARRAYRNHERQESKSEKEARMKQKRRAWEREATQKSKRTTKAAQCEAELRAHKFQSVGQSESSGGGRAYKGFDSEAQCWENVNGDSMASYECPETW